MLKLLTDEHISPKVADHFLSKRPDISIVSIQIWRGGEFLTAQNDVIMTVAKEDGLTLVTYDQSTIATLILTWATEGRDHHGIVFIDDRSIPQEDVGGKVRALINLWDQLHDHQWMNVVIFLRPTQ